MLESPRSLLLEGIVLGDGSRATVLITGGLVAEVASGIDRASTAALAATDRVDRLDLHGYVLLPAPVEAHAHLDKALLSDRLPHRTVDLSGAIAAVRRSYTTTTTDDLRRRATQAVGGALAYGSTAIRTHADCNVLIGTRAVEALVQLREELDGVVKIQVVALAGFPVTGPEGEPNRRSLSAAMAAGADLVGGVPALDPNPEAAIGELLAVAREAGCGVDLHIDETTDPQVLSLRHLAKLVSGTRFERPVTASHCVSLGMQSPSQASEIARVVAEAGIRVVTLPQSNLYLQGRGAATQVPRGLTAIAALRRAGVTVAGGSDNWRDPFNPMGRADPLQTAALLVLAGHQSPDEAYAAVSEDARSVLSLPPVRIAAGYPADLLAVRGNSLTEVLATGCADRLVLSGGNPVVRTRVDVQWLPR